MIFNVIVKQKTPWCFWEENLYEVKFASKSLEEAERVFRNEHLYSFPTPLTYAEVSFEAI